MRVTRTRTWQRVRQDPVLAGALAFALVATAHAEYTLATATHVHPWVAIAVPGALDLYVVRALAKGRDVFVAVALMVAANVTSHLIAANVLVVGWEVISAVGALAPLLLWRVHALGRTRNRTELLWGLEVGESGALKESGPESAPDSVECDCSWWRRVRNRCECTPALDASAPHSDDAFGPALLWGPAHSPSEVASAPAFVPAEWSAPVLHLPTSPEYTALLPGDDDYLAEAEAYVSTTPEPSVRGFMKIMRAADRGIGQKRAERLLEHLGVR